MANTVIQLKWSELTSTPASLNVAEPAYSNTSGKLFIGQAGNQVVAVGGKYYTDIVDAATDANTSSTLVKRDASGIFSATAVRASLFGNANTATIWQTARTIGVSGDANGTVSIDGSANANIPLTLGNSGVTAGGYGSVTQIPTFTVDSKGRITSAANVSISTSLTVAGDSGSNVIALATDTLTFVGGDGITTSITPTDNVRFDVDNTVIRTSGGQTISGSLTVTGNLVISGNTVTQDVETMKVEDSLIQLAANNAADAVDIGFFGQYNDGATKYTSFFRDASDSGKFKLLTGGTVIPSAANSVDPTTYSTATLVANITGGTVSGLTSDITVSDGGTGASSFTGGQLIVGNGSSALQSKANVTQTVTGSLATSKTITAITFDGVTGGVTAYTGSDIAIATSQVTSGILPIARGGSNNDTFTASQMLVFDGTKIASTANTGTAGTYANASHVPVITTDAYGRVSAVTNTAISISTSQVTSGTLPIARGGTNQTSFTAGQRLVFDGSSLASQANTTTTVTGGLSAANTITAISYNAYGDITAYTGAAIAIGASQITSGTLATARGGTGLSTFTAKGVFYASDTSTVTQVASATEGHVLQINASGVPTFGHLNGGSF
jgi:hypothetical protein